MICIVQGNKLLVFSNTLSWTSSHLLTTKDHKREGMSDTGAGDHLDVGAVQVCVLDVVEEGVTPVDAVRLVVDGESIGPSKQDVSEDHHVGPVKVGPADIGRPVPFWEEHITGKRRGNSIRSAA